MAFYFIIMLYASLHELVHHFFGFAVCGAWGVKTFNYFQTACEGTFGSYMATAAGPVFTFGMMYVGWWLLARVGSTHRQRQLGFAIIFAQLPLQRITGPLMGLNDEQSIAAHYFGDSWVTNLATFVAILAVCWMPLRGAWHAIANDRKLAWFTFYLVLFPYLLWGPIFGGLEYALTKHGVLSERWIGIAHLFLVNEAVTVAGHLWTGHWMVAGERR